MAETTSSEEFSTPTSNPESKKDTAIIEKDIYFFISYPRKEKEKEKDFIFTKYEKEPIKIYSREIEGKNGTFLYEKCFKLKKKFQKKEENKKSEDSKKTEDTKSQKKDNKKDGEKKER